MGMQTDIELAITEFGSDRISTLSLMLPPGYVVEDRTRTGYGLVVRSQGSEAIEEINAKLKTFLEKLLAVAEIARDYGCIARVAVFSSTVTTTALFNIDCLEALRVFNAKLEISVYPIGEDD